MLYVLNKSLIQTVNKNIEQFYLNNGKIRVYKEKFNSLHKKYPLNFSEELFSTSKSDLKFTKEFGTNNINITFNELYKVFQLIEKFAEIIEKTFQTLIEKVDDRISLKNIIFNRFFNALNNDDFLKYCLLFTKSKNSKSSIIIIEQIFNESKGSQIIIEKKLIEEMRILFDKFCKANLKFNLEEFIDINEYKDQNIVKEDNNDKKIDLKTEQKCEDIDCLVNFINKGLKSKKKSKKQSSNVTDDKTADTRRKERISSDASSYFADKTEIKNNKVDKNDINLSSSDEGNSHIKLNHSSINEKILIFNDEFIKSNIDSDDEQIIRKFALAIENHSINKFSTFKVVPKWN